MRHLTTILFVLLLPLTLLAGNGTWEKQLNILEVQTSTIYGIQETNRTSGQDTKLVSKFSGYIFLDYTRKEFSDLEVNPLASAWNVKVTYHVVGDPTLRYLNISYEDGNYVYSDYNTVTTTNNGFEVVIDKIDGNYRSASDGLWHYTSNAAASQYIPNDIDVRLELRTETIYAMDPGVVADQSRMGFNTSSYRVNWSFVEGAEWYDLEWVFIDDLSLEKTQIATVFGTSVATEYDYPFELKEPTRVRVWGTNYTIDKAYPAGVLYFRVRSVSTFTDNGSAVDQIKPGSWNYFYNPANYGGSIDINDIVKYTIGTGFESDKNWLYSASFAEDGKSVNTMSFYDGNNRGRQNIAYNTSDNVSLVGESKYDREGRQTIDVIPAPVAGRQLLYRNDFNLAGDGTTFDEEDYDLQNATDVVAPLSTTGSGTRGAAQYFSPNNTFGNDLYRSAIPNAGGYVFSQTIYRNDGSGRIERVGGVGQEFQASGVHAVQTFYGSPTEYELKRLFGPNVSDNPNGYRKEMIRDQNGQYSVSYYDKRGNVIATALAGNAPNGLHAIENSGEETVTTDLSDNNIVVNGNQIISEHTFLSTIDNNVITLNYSLAGLVTTLNAQTITIGNQEVSIGALCATCHYDLTIKVLNSDGSDVIAPITTSIDPTGCAAGSYTYNSPSIPLGLAGEYRIIKILTIDNDAMLAGFNNLLETQGLTNGQDFIDAYLYQVDLTGCFDNCDDYCVALWQLEYVQHTPGAKPQDAVAAWENLSTSAQETFLAECGADVCNPDEVNDDFDYPGEEPLTACTQLREAALDQISPGGIFYDNVNSSFWSSVPSSVTINGNTYSKSSLQDPVNYTEEIAEYMLENYHRERCHLEFCEAWDASNHYSIGLTQLIQSTPWNISSNIFAEPYNNDVYSWTHDPLEDATGLLMTRVDNFMTEQYNLSVLNGTPWGCGSSWATNGNLADYVAAYADCMILLDPSMTPDEIEQMRKALFLGLYNRIKEDVIASYKSSQGCVYYGDDYALFKAPPTQEDMEDAAAEVVSGILNGQTCAQKAWNQTTLWMEQIPTSCLEYWNMIQLDGNGQWEPTYTEQDLIDAYANGAVNTLAAYFYAFSMEACAVNTWGWFYDPQGGPGTTEYNAIQSMLSECSYISLPLPFEVPTPNIITVGVLNQQFPDCFLGFVGVLNDGFAALNNCTPPCTGGIILEVSETTYPAVELACNNPGLIPGELSIVKTGGTYVITYDARRDGGCDGTIPLQLFQAPSYPQFPSTLSIAQLTNPVKMIMNGNNIVVFDVVLTDGSIVQGFINMKNFPCLDAGTFKDDQGIAEIGDFPGLTTFTIDCIESEMAQAEIDAQLLYNGMLQELQNQYLEVSANCLNVTETLNMTYKIKEYQYMLYYYDLANNLVQTVPPQGVEILDAAGIAAGTYPPHRMETRYQYDGMNIMVASFTPDDDHTDLYFNKLHRMRFSQNARQASEGKASYMKYDDLGRVTEAGEFKIPSGDILAAKTDIVAYPSAGLLDYTRTIYEEGYTTDATIATQFGTAGQENLRNSVGAVIQRQGDYDPSTGVLITGTEVLMVISYSYDPHKNVKQVVTTNYQLQDIGHQHKKTEYTYDVLSGGTEEIVYQKGAADEYRHRYHYDANNRLVRTFTSKNGVQWEMDAKYFYYLHGTLARTELGHDKVQGTDYAHNLQGWLKGVNSTTLNNQRDLGRDGGSGLNQWSGSDAMGYQLGYFANDYQSIITTTAFVNTNALTGLNMVGGNNAGSLYNGNITHMVAAIRKVDETVLDILGNNYQYDQLQRIKEMKVYFASGLVTDNTFAGAAPYRPGTGVFAGQTAYQENYAFDKNGNLKTLKRNGSGINDVGGSVALGMDNFTYSYYTDLTNNGTTIVTNPTLTNRLAQVSDAETSDPYSGDIATSQATNNYQYDKTGQLTKDLQEGIDQIEWTATGKVKRIRFTTAAKNGGKKDLKFIYDPMDRRVAKLEYQTNAPYTWIKYTFYTYDAGGNVMAIYERNTKKNDGNNNYTDNLVLADHIVYGSSRIGTETSDKLIAVRTFTMSSGSLEAANVITNNVVSQQTFDWTMRRVRDKGYELSNHLGNVLDVITDRKIRDRNSDDQRNDFNDATVQGWTGYNYSGCTNMPTLTNDNSKLKVATTCHGGANKYFDVIPGETYTVSFDIVNTTGTTIDFRRIDYITPGAAGYTNDVTVGLVGSNHFEYTFTATKEWLRLAFYCYATNNSFTLDNVKLTNQRKYSADVINYTDYSPYGMLLQHRFGQETNADYRYGFQGQEMDNEIKGPGNSINYEFRMHDPRIGRFFAVDPLSDKYPWYSPYQFSGNKVIQFVEREGLEEGAAKNVPVKNVHYYNMQKQPDGSYKVPEKPYFSSHYLNLRGNNSYIKNFDRSYTSIGSGYYGAQNETTNVYTYWGDHGNIIKQVVHCKSNTLELVVMDPRAKAQAKAEAKVAPKQTGSTIQFTFKSAGASGTFCGNSLAWSRNNFVFGLDKRNIYLHNKGMVVVTEGWGNGINPTTLAEGGISATFGGWGYITNVNPYDNLPELFANADDWGYEGSGSLPLLKGIDFNLGGQFIHGTSKGLNGTVHIYMGSYTFGVSAGDGYGWFSGNWTYNSVDKAPVTGSFNVGDTMKIMMNYPYEPISMSKRKSATYRRFDLQF